MDVRMGSHGAHLEDVPARLSSLSCVHDALARGRDKTSDPVMGR